MIQRDGARPAAGGTAMIRYTGWRQRTGETFFTTSARGQAVALNLAGATPAFREALPLLRKGENAMIWVSEAEGTAEPVVYELELVDVAAPAAPVAPPGSPSERRSTVPVAHEATAAVVR